ncbi:MAG: glycosyltransferase family 4 protein [Desulfovibrio sp.]|nr:glycosyltransferase family 4 protein [Desulfovibrio sp.]
MSAQRLLPSQAKPRIGCILLWYPLFTQPFIFREIEGLKNFLPVTVYALYGTNLKHCSTEMQAAATTVSHHGITFLPHILAALGKELVTNPKRLFGLFRRFLVKKWPSLEIFGENLWAFCMGLALAHKLKGQVDLLYAPWPRGTATAASVIHAIIGIPFGITVRGDNLEPADPDFTEKMKDCVFVRANNHADQILIEAYADGIAAKKTQLIYNSLTLPKQNPPIHIATYTPKQTLKIMALGRFDVTKGFITLIQACALLREKNLNFSLTLAGGGGIIMGLGGLEKEIHALTAKLKLTQYIHFPGLISHNELPSMLAQHDIFVAPCEIAPSGKRDGIPNTVIEAMSMGLPVVSSNIHALPEVVLNHQTGLTTNPHDPQALSAAILWLAQHPKDAADMGEKGRAHARALFDPEHNAQKLADLMQQSVQMKG